MAAKSQYLPGSPLSKDRSTKSQAHLAAQHIKKLQSQRRDTIETLNDMFDINLQHEKEPAEEVKTKSLRSYKKQENGKERKRAFSMIQIQSTATANQQQDMSPTSSIFTELELPDDQAAVPGFLAKLELEVINEHPKEHDQRQSLIARDPKQLWSLLKSTPLTKLTP